jgi:hypothetical protein
MNIENQIQPQTGDIIIIGANQADQRDHLMARLYFMRHVIALPDCGRLYDAWDASPQLSQHALFATALSFANLRLHVGYAWLPDELIRYWHLRREVAARQTTIVVPHEIVGGTDLPAGKGHGKGKGSREATLEKYVEWHFRWTVPPRESWRGIARWDAAGLRRQDEHGQPDEIQRNWIKKAVPEVERLLRLGNKVAGHLSHD